MGKCDYILVPRISNFGNQRNMCTRFEAMPDLVRSAFRDSRQKILSYEVDALLKKEESDAFAEMGRSLGYPVKAARRAYKLGKEGGIKRLQSQSPAARAALPAGGHEGAHRRPQLCAGGPLYGQARH